MKGRLAPEREFIRLAMIALRKQSPRPRVLLTVANNRPRRVQDRWLLKKWFASGPTWTRHAHELLSLVDPVGLSLMRNGSPHKITVTLEEQPRLPAAYGIPSIPEPTGYRPAGLSGHATDFRTVDTIAF